jgi:hypothetical protein
MHRLLLQSNDNGPAKLAALDASTKAGNISVLTATQQ